MARVRPALYPPAVIDYVVMHELCHLEYMHHGPAFHALMDRRMPDGHRCGGAQCPPPAIHHLPHEIVGIEIKN